jgi:CheY-like chemotaxis protein
VTGTVTPWAELAVERQVAHDDDRDNLMPSDIRVLVVGDDSLQHLATKVARERDVKVLIARDVDGAVELTNRYAADAVVLAQEDTAEALAMLDELKRRPRSRHLFAHVAIAPEDWPTARDAGAARLLPMPVTEAALAELLEEVRRRHDDPRRTVLVAAPDEARRHDVIGLIGGDPIDVVSARSCADARRILAERDIDCLVLDVEAGTDDAVALIEELGAGSVTGDDRHVPVVLMPTGAALDDAVLARIDAARPFVTVAPTAGPQELFDTTALYLHRAVVQRHEDAHRMRTATPDPVLVGRRVLIVDDDVRNVFAVSAALEAQGMHVIYADNGRDGIRRLEANPDVELVLMDIMMPEMDGYETMAAIRALPAFTALPIIALTAKALTGDREKAIAAGASDYITKPVDMDKLLAMLASWLVASGADVDDERQDRRP